MYQETPVGGGCVLWRSSSTESSESAVIPADGCVDLIERDGDWWLAGPSTVRIVTKPGAATDAFGIRFAPGLASAVLRINPSAVRDAGAPLSDVVGARRAREVAEAARTQCGTPSRNLVLDALSDLSTAEGRWVQGVRSAAIEQRDPRAVARLLGWSDRHLRRRMVATFGYGYGALVRVERARRARALIARGVSLAEVASAAGYADQPHMTRDFVTLVGRTPGQVAGSVAKRSTELPSGSSSVAYR